MKKSIWAADQRGVLLLRVILEASDTSYECWLDQFKADDKP